MLLALQNLRCLTDDVKTSPVIAMIVSKSIVVEAEEGVREMLLCYMNGEDLDEEDDPAGMVAQHRHISFGIFANALENCAKHGSLSKALASDEWLQWQLLPALLSCVKNVARHAGDAYGSCLSLIAMASCSDIATRLMLNAGALENLQAAIEHGEKYHDLLLATAGKCLDILTQAGAPNKATSRSA